MKNHKDLDAWKMSIDLVADIYKITKKFPKDEIYGITSQLRRATLSIILNYVEGYGRRKTNVLKNFLEISYGSLKETKYLLEFSYKLNYYDKKDYDLSYLLTEKIGKMLWGILEKL